MNRKMKLYVSLLALGILLIGSGVWLMHGSAAKISSPEGNPVIVEERNYLLGGEHSYLYVYKDGSVTYIEEKGLRGVPTRDNPPTRIWKTGQLQREELDQLTGLFQSAHFAELDEYYLFPVRKNERGATVQGDMSYTISIDYGDLRKKVTTFGYLTPDQGLTYPDMPSPLNEIYGRLRTLSMATQEVYRENIS